MTDEQIVANYCNWDFGSGTDCDQLHADLLAALAAARAEQHAEDVRWLREDLGFGYAYAADRLESHKPEASK